MREAADDRLQGLEFRTLGFLKRLVHFRQRNPSPLRPSKSCTNFSVPEHAAAEKVKVTIVQPEKERVSQQAEKEAVQAARATSAGLARTRAVSALCDSFTSLADAGGTSARGRKWLSASEMNVHIHRLKRFQCPVCSSFILAAMHYFTIVFRIFYACITYFEFEC